MPAAALAVEGMTDAETYAAPITLTRAIALLDTMHRVDQQGAELLVAESGTDMTRCGTGPRVECRPAALGQDPSVELAPADRYHVTGVGDAVPSAGGSVGGRHALIMPGMPSIVIGAFHML